MVAHPSPDLGPLPWWSPHRPSGRGKVVWIGTCGRETFAPMRLLERISCWLLIWRGQSEPAVPVVSRDVG